MDKFVITGGAPLHGEIPTSGSKNSALPALAAALLTDEPVMLRRIPRVRDIRTMQRLLVDIGSQVEETEGAVRLHTPHIVCPEAPYELVKTMRASSLVLGPLVARSGRARVSLPGRLRHRRAADQSARLRPGASGREDHPGARLHRSGGAGWTARRGGELRPHHGHRHRRSADGGRAGQGRNRAAQRRARAGSGGSGRIC